MFQFVACRTLNTYTHITDEMRRKAALNIDQGIAKAEIAALRSGASKEYPDGANPRKKAIAAYLREHPNVTNRARIARELHLDRSTVCRYYDEVRAEVPRRG